MRRFTTAALALCAATSIAFAADGFVTPDGLTHLEWLDRSPAVPVRGESFAVRLQTLAGDLTGVQVNQYVFGEATKTFDAQVVGQRGPYEIWEATLDGSLSDLVLYDFTLIDGADVDAFGVGGHGETFATGGAFSLNFNTWTHAPRGATTTSDGVVFKVWAPTAPSVFLRGSFNAWSLANPMDRVGEDMVLHLTNAQEGDEYKFFFGDTQTWKSDPNARRMIDFENAVVVDPEGYAWQSAPFTPPDFDSMVHYQLHVGSFAGNNDPAGPAPFPSRFIDVTARIQHLLDLGVNTVYLNPVNEWPSAFSGGYNPISYTAIERSYGTPNELKALVDALHQNGIAVILDVVPNHVDFSGNFLFGYQGPLAAADNIYFDTPPIDTPWGPQLDFNNAEVRDYVIQSVVQQLEEYRFDGLRVDALSAMIFGPQAAQGTQVLQEINSLSDQRWADKFLVAEEFSDNPYITRSVTQGGLGFEAQYHNGWKNPLRDAVFGAAFGNVNVSNIAGAMTKAGELSGSRVWNYFELHDEVWGLSGGERAVVTIDTTFPHDDQFAAGRTKLAHGLTLMSKGVPAFVMGTEWIEDNEWENERIDWTHRFLYSEVVDYYREMIALRTGEPALWADALARTIHLNDGADVFAVERFTLGGDSFLIVANFSNTTYAGPNAYRLGLPREGTWKVAVNSDAAWYFGAGNGQQGLFEAEPIPFDFQPWSVALELPPHGLLVLEHAPEFLETESVSVEVASGGSIELELDATVDHAGDIYWVLGSLSGNGPG
ncbi:MAG: alpha-amylase family glycosyl hydrolase, partial [Planctomycetota bacterium]